MQRLIKLISKRQAKQSAVVIMALILFGCGGDVLIVTTNFENTQDVKEGASVYFQDKPVAEVIDVKEQKTGAIVVMEFDEEFAQNISRIFYSRSLFYQNH